MVTASEIEAVWSVIGKIGVVVGVLVALIKGFQYLMSLTPTSKLEQRVLEIEKHDKNDLEKFKNIEVRLDALESKITESDDKMKRIDEGIQRIGKSQILLLKHFVTGNGQQEMSKEADELTAYFIDRN